MGATVLAIGNALPDAFTTIAIAKKGMAYLAITGSLAGIVLFLFFVIFL